MIIGFKEYDTVEYAKEHPDFADQIKDAVEKMTKSDAKGISDIGEKR